MVRTLVVQQDVFSLANRQLCSVQLHLDDISLPPVLRIPSRFDAQSQLLRPFAAVVFRVANTRLKVSLRFRHRLLASTTFVVTEAPMAVTPPCPAALNASNCYFDRAHQLHRMRLA